MRPLLLACLSLLVLAVPAAAQDLARVDRPTPIDAHAGWLAWSVRADDGRYRLTLRDPSGVVSTPAVPAKGTTFDVDLGPGPDGLVATYSRCAQEVGTPGGFVPADYDEGRGCDAYVLDVATGRERRLAGPSTADADETWPTIWRDRVAFVRSYDARPSLPYLYVRPLAGGRSVRQPGGTRQVCTGRSCTDARVSRPYALDLYGRRLAFGWTYAGRSEGLDTEIRLDTLGGGHARIAYQRGGGLTGRALGWPASEDGRVYFSSACYADLGGCIRTPEVLRHRITTGETTGADAEKGILGHARDRGTTYLLVDEASGTDCQGDPAVPGGTCVLRALRPAYG